MAANALTFEEIEHELQDAARVDAVVLGNPARLP